MYDYIFITHLPAFYKVNLYNRLAKRLKLYVVFLASSSQIRTADFVSADLRFDYAILHTGDFESRPRVHTCFQLLKLLSSLSYRMLVVGGWDLLEFWVGVFMSPKSANGIVVESTVAESAARGVRAIAKRVFLARIDTVFVAGRLHERLIIALHFRGRRILTGGVGLINDRKLASADRHFPLSFLYVGRLAPEKNLIRLVEVFNEFPHLKLTIVGSGPQEAILRRMAYSNVTLLSHVSNQTIAAVYSRHHCLILPSTREPWGLVVDEALAAGLPVIVSNRVGSHTELVQEGSTGLLFDPESKDELARAILHMSMPGIYRRMRLEVAALDVDRRANAQCEAYARAIRSERGHTDDVAS